MDEIVCQAHGYQINGSWNTQNQTDDELIFVFFPPMVKKSGPIAINNSIMAKGTDAQSGITACVCSIKMRFYFYARKGSVPVKL